MSLSHCLLVGKVWEGARNNSESILQEYKRWRHHIFPPQRLSIVNMDHSRRETNCLLTIFLSSMSLSYSILDPTLGSTLAPPLSRTKLWYHLLGRPGETLIKNNNKSMLYDHKRGNHHISMQNLNRLGMCMIISLILSNIKSIHNRYETKQLTHEPNTIKSICKVRTVLGSTTYKHIFQILSSLPMYGSLAHSYTLGLCISSVTRVKV
jgi:hypothetical protein